MLISHMLRTVHYSKVKVWPLHVYYDVCGRLTIEINIKTLPPPYKIFKIIDADQGIDLEWNYLNYQGEL